MPSGAKLKSNDVVGEVAKMWKSMSDNAKVAATEDLLDELVEARQEADTKAKITPVHILNDVSATMAKINREVHYPFSHCSIC